MLIAIALTAAAFTGRAVATFAQGGQAQNINQYTATSASDVYAAQATAKTESPTSNVRGKAFDRFVVIWLENTDYTKAVGDREWGCTLLSRPSCADYVYSQS